MNIHILSADANNINCIDINTNTMELVYEVNANDVLLGRGTGPNDHPGNMAFRNLIQRLSNEYAAVILRGDKAKVARKVVHVVHDVHKGRFLRKLSTREIEDIMAARKKGKQPAVDDDDDHAVDDDHADDHVDADVDHDKEEGDNQLPVPVPVEAACAYVIISDEPTLILKTKQAFQHRIRCSFQGDNSQRQRIGSLKAKKATSLATGESKADAAYFNETQDVKETKDFRDTKDTKDTKDAKETSSQPSQLSQGNAIPVPAFVNAGNVNSRLDRLLRLPPHHFQLHRAPSQFPTFEPGFVHHPQRQQQQTNNPSTIMRLLQEEHNLRERHHRYLNLVESRQRRQMALIDSINSAICVGRTAISTDFAVDHSFQDAHRYFNLLRVNNQHEASSTAHHRLQSLAETTPMRQEMFSTQQAPWQSSLSSTSSRSSASLPPHLGTAINHGSSLQAFLASKYNRNKHTPSYHGA